MSAGRPGPARATTWLLLATSFFCRRGRAATVGVAQNCAARPRRVRRVFSVEEGILAGVAGGFEVGEANCYAMVLATSRSRKSPITKPRVAPPRLLSATRRPNARSATAARASRETTSNKSCDAFSSSKTDRRISAVSPLGPGAAPRCARCRFARRAERSS